MPIVLAVLSAAVAGGCGETEPPGKAEPRATRTVAGPGFTIAVDVEREVARTPRSLTVLPAEEGSPELESVTIFRLVKPYRPALWAAAAKELDSVADRLAESLDGELAAEPRTVRRGGLRGRLYEIDYAREGVDLRQRLTLLLSRRTEYQLLCRWDASLDTPGACKRLEASFKRSS